MPVFWLIDVNRDKRNLSLLQLPGEILGQGGDGQEALTLIARENWDLVMLDLMLPEIDGWSVCKEIRKNTTTPIIMLTARDAEMDRILGLDLGADDYVTKPFSPRELVARVKAVLRRSKSDPASINSATGSAINHPGIFIDPGSHQVLVNGQEVNLTPKEYDLLYHLARSPNRAFTRSELLEALWGYDYYGDARTVDTHVNRLRDKLVKVSGASSYIASVWGVGYKFEAGK
ncbi:MAG: Transcriptional regulatory protein SrrA [Pelotomaculum sp. PtaB.Bin104]|nr:MAG: Transcriptional regulatory protein SrrA [Pelotomaculum sp. PtaB.Bin104]